MRSWLLVVMLIVVTSCSDPTRASNSPTIIDAVSPTTIMYQSSGGIIDVGDPEARTGLWSSDAADHAAVLTRFAEEFPFQQTDFDLCGGDCGFFITPVGPHIDFEDTGPANPFQDAATSWEFLEGRGYTLLYSRCEAEPDFPIVDIIFDSGEDHLVWVEWTGDERGNLLKGGVVSLHPIVIDDPGFGFLLGSQDQLLEVIDRLPVQAGLDPRCIELGVRAGKQTND